jgi:hypothetical protein
MRQAYGARQDSRTDMADVKIYIDALRLVGDR